MTSQSVILNNALKNKYAVGAFNFSSLAQLNAIIEACKETNSPAILAVSVGALNFLGDEIFKGIVEKINKSKITASLHLDHGNDFDICKRAIDLGFNSVMIDGSLLSFEENICLTKKVCTYAQKLGVHVEGELGALGNTDDDETVRAKSFTDPKQVYEFVKKTGVDSLAVAIGTSHGAYKYAYDGKLRVDILEQIRKLCPNLPLVLHGASLVEKNAIDRLNAAGGNLKNTSGNAGKLAGIYKTNICKINMDTDLRIAFITAVREYLNANKDCLDMRKVDTFATNEMKKLIIDRIKNVLKSENKVK